MKDLRLLLLLSIFCAMFFITSCSHTYYNANTHNVPLFEEKNEFRISMTDISNIGGEFEFQGAYALTDNIGIAGNCYFTPGVHYFDISSGMYKPLNSNYIFETYVGAGLYNQSHTYTTAEYYSGLNLILPVNVGTSNLKAVRSFIQPSIGLKTEYVDIAFSPRFTSFYVFDVKNNINVELDSGNYAEKESSILNGISNHKSYFFFDPAITLRVGWKYIKFQAQYSYNIPVGYNNFNYKESNLSIGIYFAYAKYYFDRNNK